jgi:hypothetical protein
MYSITGVQNQNPPLLIVLERVRSGQVVLPDFQRNFVWPRDQVIALVQSVLEGYYIGTFLTLESDSKNPQFQFRLFEGVSELDPTVDPIQHPISTLMLDGQQRITALFYAFYEPPIPLKETKHPFRFFVDLEQLIHGNMEDAIQAISVSNKKVVEQYTNLQREGAVLPLHYFKDTNVMGEYLYTQQIRWKKEDIKKINNVVWNILTKQTLQTLTIDRETPAETVVNTFERLNKAGLRLSVFDLATAHLYTKRIYLRNDWQSLKNQLPSDLVNKEFMQAEMALRVAAILNSGDPRTGKLIKSLPKEPKLFSQIWEKTSNGIYKAWQRLKQQYGVLDVSFMPNRSMFVPLAAILGGHEKPFDSSQNLKIDTWFWIAVLEQRYANSADSKSVNDYMSVSKWVERGEKPEFVKKFDLSNVDLTIKDRNEDAALFKAFKCLLIIKKAKDLKTGLIVGVEDNQDDHLFPDSTEALYGNLGNILNLALLTEKTNKEKSNMSPRRRRQQTTSNIRFSVDIRRML